MKKEQEIKKAIENELLIHQKAVIRLTKALDALKEDEDEEPTIGGDLNDTRIRFPGYPLEDKPINQFRFLEEKFKRAWSKNEMKQLKIDAEGKIPKYLAQEIYLAVKDKNLVCMKFNNSNKYTYYTTHKEWIEKDFHGRGKHRILPEHAPVDERLNKLSEAQRNPENITWSGFE